MCYELNSQATLRHCDLQRFLAASLVWNMNWQLNVLKNLITLISIFYLISVYSVSQILGQPWVIRPERLCSGSGSILKLSNKILFLDYPGEEQNADLKF